MGSGLVSFGFVRFDKKVEGNKGKEVSRRVMSLIMKFRVSRK